jgi:hypothetical protein
MDKQTVKKLIGRRHPEYSDHVAHWDFCEDTYEGGPEWFREHLFRYFKEGDKEYADRVKRGYRFNHTREVVELVDKYLFKVKPTRSESAPESVRQFWEKSLRGGGDIDDLMRTVSNRSSTLGRCYVVVDNNAPTEGVLTLAEQKRQGVGTYAYTVMPQDVLDMSFDESRRLNWILIRETWRDDSDPLASSGATNYRYRLWDRSNWTLITITKQKGDEIEYSVTVGEHGLGDVPVIPVNHAQDDGDDLYTAPGLVDDVAYLDRACANYLSNLDAIIQDQTFSQLAIPAQSIEAGSDAHKKIVEMGTKRIFTYDSEGGQPFYLSPDVKQAELILKVVNKVISEIYHTVGLAGERTKEDNGGGIDNSSGVAKAYDFERANALLTSKADCLEQAENRIAYLVAKWNGDTIDKDVVTYPDDFDTRGLYDEFEIAARLALIEAPDEVRQEQMYALIDKLFPQVKEEVLKKLKAAVKTWPPDPVEMAKKMAEVGAVGGAPTSNPIKKEGSNSRSNQMVNS